MGQSLLLVMLNNCGNTGHIVPSVNLTTVGKRAFPVTAANLWNSLSTHRTSAPSLAIFRRSYPDLILWHSELTSYRGPSSNCCYLGYVKKLDDDDDDDVLQVTTHPECSKNCTAKYKTSVSILNDMPYYDDGNTLYGPDAVWTIFSYSLSFITFIRRYCDQSCLFVSYLVRLLTWTGGSNFLRSESAIFMKCGMDVQHLCQMSLFTFEMSRSKLPYCNSSAVV